MDLFNYKDFKNPFRPGAGHMPPYLAGRETEQDELGKLLDQDVILKNMILTGLRGTGKTVLLERFRSIGIQRKWMWVGTDWSETTSVSEENVAKRLLTDLAIKTSSVVLSQRDSQRIGFDKSRRASTDQPYKSGNGSSGELRLDYRTLDYLYQTTPGLTSDKIKYVLELVWTTLSANSTLKGVVFAYDEAQNMADHSDKNEYPLSVLLDVFQSLQRKEIPFLLVLTGLPTLHSKLIEARTFSERMFHVVELSRLSQVDTQHAIRKPIEKEDCPVRFDDKSIGLVADTSGGYPYFIQFICREVYDIFIQKINAGQDPSVPIADIVQKLDSDFFAGRWSRATDRQRELLTVAADIENCTIEFTVNDLAQASKEKLEKAFSNSHIHQMLSKLCDTGLVYKNRRGKYSFAVPLIHEFIKRQAPNMTD